MKKIVFLLTITLAFVLTSCIEGPEPLLPKFKTLEPTDVTSDFAILRGIAGSEKDRDLENPGSYRNKIKVKFIISDNASFNPEGLVIETAREDAEIGEEFSRSFSGLERGKTYYYKFVYAGGKTSEDADDLGHLWNVVSFKTLAN